MSDKDDCGHCDYQGDDITLDHADCMIDCELYPRGYRCQDFKVHSPGGKLMDVRLAQAAAKRKERDDKRDREHAEEITRINREHDEKMAEKDREWAGKLQQERMKFDRGQRRKSFREQAILAVFSALLGFIVGWLLKP